MRLTGTIRFELHLAHEGDESAILRDLTEKLARSDAALADAMAAAGGTPSSHKGNFMAKNATPPTGNPVLDALIAQVDAEQTVVASAVAFITGVPQMITDAVNKAIAGGATAAQLAPLTDLATAIGTNTAALTAALTNNVPTPTPTPPTP